MLYRCCNKIFLFSAEDYNIFFSLSIYISYSVVNIIKVKVENIF